MTDTSVCTIAQRAKWRWLRTCVAVCLVVACGLSPAVWASYSHVGLDRQWQQALAAAPARVIGQFPYADCFADAAQRYQLALPLLLAVARGESNFDSRVVSKANAIGVMQIQWPRIRLDSRVVSKANAIGVMQIQWPRTAHHLGIVNQADLYKPCLNIDAGARYLRQLIDQFGSTHTALAAYNYGPGRIQRAGDAIPQGALWYSSYIYDHWQAVLSTAAAGDFTQQQLIDLIAFTEPFRAQGFVRNLQQRAPGIRIQWFKRSAGRYVVVAEFSDPAQAAGASAMLRRLGFAITR